MSQFTKVAYQENPQTQVPRIRLPYLDGLRGIAALYVVMCHVYTAIMFGCDGAGASSISLQFLKLFKYGHYMVDLFIVLSGYVLSIPIVVASSTLKGGFWTYFLKRVVRIIPPFYLSLMLAFLVSQMPSVPGFRTMVTESPLSQYVAHLFLVNNWSQSWRIGSNQPLWSVAVEWQIYMMFPLVLLPIWKRFGVVTMVILAIVGGITVNLITSGLYSSAHTWFVGLFAIGVLTAEICHGVSNNLSIIKSWKSIWIIPIGMFASVSIANRWVDFSEARFMWLSDTLIGIGFAAAILALTSQSSRVGGGGRFIEILTSRPIQFLGSISYSVYLFHWPLLEVVMKTVLAMKLNADMLVLSVIFVGVPTIVAVCALLSMLVEQPMIRLAKRLAT